jgi:hypothetical protein
MRQELDTSARAAIIERVITTVEKKHYDPKFDCEQWRSAAEAQRPVLVEGNIGEFKSALNDLVRTSGTPDSGFFHESSRKKVPKGPSMMQVGGRHAAVRQIDRARDRLAAEFLKPFPPLLRMPSD